MHLTVDIRIAGCAARCRHCYVNGEAGPLMPFEEYLRWLDLMNYCKK